MTLFWLWLIVAGGCVVAEVLTLAFFAAFLAAGALGAALASLLGFDLLAQAIVFLLVGVGGMVAGRPALVGALGRRKEPLLRSGADSMVGHRTVLVDPIGPSLPGHVRIAGELWPAITADGRGLPANTPVIVTALRSSTLIVETVPENAVPPA